MPGDYPAHSIPYKVDAGPLPHENTQFCKADESSA